MGQGFIFDFDPPITRSNMVSIKVFNHPIAQDLIQ
jgi:hypothetical protein